MVKSKKDITLGKQKTDGREFLIEYPKGCCRLRIFLRGDRLYQVGVVSPSKDWTASDAVTQFLDSFEIR
jgi:hypothetical protein